ncbi:HIT-like domain-containing protein [Gymnopilus junonius]|uniref:HIT-like domain-containing protein n=1 Tax=Gymnopilus junonius TaxID=109634 RepID=A0A9P5NRC2_GYMJU|nr:HIT-like domain-containing protein [Gymnopilus junonius]
MSNLTILRTYAKAAPESLPASLLFKHSAKNITIFDAYPKSIFHFLILPRIKEPRLNATVLSNLKSLINGDKGLAKEVISSLDEEAKTVKKEIQEEMLERYGFKWDVWIGFHGAPSMDHLHLHVISADLISEKLKNKKHYNSFHPKLGFFLHIDEVLSWFDADPTYYMGMVKQFKPSKFEPILKDKLACFHCEMEMKNMPTLKSHLQEEWDKLERRSRDSAKRKRKLEERADSQSTNDNEQNSRADSVF